MLASRETPLAEDAAPAPRTPRPEDGGPRLRRSSRAQDLVDDRGRAFAGRPRDPHRTRLAPGRLRFDHRRRGQGPRARPSLLARLPARAGHVASLGLARRRQKTLTVRAEAGAPVHSRRIVFTGNAQVSRERLQALVKDKRRAEAAWLAPEELREAVLAVYKSEGFLAATVEAPRISFAGDEARLTVTIDEGPVVPIREVRVTGAERLTAETVLAAAASARGPTLQARGDRSRQGFGRIRISAARLQPGHGAEQRRSRRGHGHDEGRARSQGGAA